MEKKYDFLVVGAGLAGAVFARQMADVGKKVLVVEKRNHVAGNVYTERIEGIEVHKYGPHIFHTDNKLVWDYVNQYASFNRFTNTPIANYKGEIYSLPFNMYTFNQMWGITTPQEAERMISKQRKEIKTVPVNLEEQAISLVGREIYQKLIKEYTEKQWGRSCSDLPATIIRRLPIRYTYDNNYYDSEYQGIPNGGYTQMVTKMLEGIEVRLNVDYLSNRKELDQMAQTVYYTGPIDAFYGYSLGALEYRSVAFETELIDEVNYQGNAVINFTDADTPWTRIIEHKWFQFGKDIEGEDIAKTVISREFSLEWRPGIEPFYPINDDENNELYSKYRAKADKERNVIFGGRLGEYSYFDMDQVIERSLELSNYLLSR